MGNRDCWEVIGICDFFDSNVFLGFIFEHDDWYSASCNCLNNDRVKYTSSNVIGEVEHKIYEIRRIVQDEILMLIHKLNKQRNSMDYMTLSDIGWMVNFVQKKKIKSFIESCVDELKEEQPTFNEMASRLRNGLNDYMNDTMKNEIEINRRINEKELNCWVRRLPYKDLKNCISQYVKDFNDVQILLDAHDLAAKNKSLSLTFITGDNNHIIRNKEKLSDVLDINDFDYLANYN